MRTALLRSTFACAFLLAFTGIAFAQFSSTTQLVVETVTVNDRNGNPVDNLTINDFTLTEDGVPQTIKFFEFQKLPETREGPVSAGEPLNAAPYSSLAR